MDKKDLKVCKKKILKCLTEDFDYGRHKGGKPLKRPKKNQAIFDLKDGLPHFIGTDLEMVMETINKLSIAFLWSVIKKRLRVIKSKKEFNK